MVRDIGRWTVVIVLIPNILTYLTCERWLTDIDQALGLYGIEANK